MKAKQEAAFSANVRGRVQGVAFRYYAQVEAERLALTGWVRNNKDGSVDLWAEGVEDDVKTFLEWLSHGPSHARIDSLKSDWQTPVKTYKSFSITY